MPVPVDLREKIALFFKRELTFLILLVIYVDVNIILLKRGEFSDQSNSLETILIFCAGIVSLFLIERLISLAVGHHRIFLLIGRFFLVIFYMVLSLYNLAMRNFLEYSIIADNASLLFYPQSIAMLIDQLTLQKDMRKHLFGFLFLIFTLIVAEIWWRIISMPLPTKTRLTRFIYCISVYVALLVFMPYSSDQTASFFRSIAAYYSGGHNKIFHSDLSATSYSPIRHFTNVQKEKKPHVFLIMIESFNANFVRTKTPEGQEYTPFFNSLLDEGIYLTNFYGNSVQTDKGHLAALCSLFPLTSGKVFTDYPDINLQSLPEILGHNGYETLFFEGFSNLSADNEGYFMRRNGFQHVYAMNRRFITRDERRKYSWGWGLQDDIFYQKVFQFLDAIHQRESGTINQPYFVTLATISSHMRFDRVPHSQRYLYLYPKNEKECYANAIRVADEYLKTFFIELKKRDYLDNSIIFITGDHSFPVGEHGIFHNEIGFFEENFKTPLLILGKGISRSVIERPHSQLDIAPTILELAGVSAVTHFSGSSIFKQGSAPIPLIQPYDGGYFAIIRYPYKYIFSKKYDKEYLFNIDKDPGEELNIFPLWKGKQLIHEFHSDVQWILLNDFRIRHDLIWKESNAH